jgi:hypothetical protein
VLPDFCANFSIIFDRDTASRPAGSGHTSGTFNFDIRSVRKPFPYRELSARSLNSTRRYDMTYRVYSGPRGSESIAPLEKDRDLYKEFNILDEAMGWARHINNGGRVALLIEGDDGTRLTKQQIATALKHSDNETAEDAA